MQSKATRAVVAAIASAAMTVAGVAAQAAPAGPAPAISTQAAQGDNAVRLAQAVIPHWRLPGHGYRHHGYRYYGREYYGHPYPGHRHRGWRHRYRDRDDDIGAAIAGGIIGLAAGAIIAGSASRGAGRTVQYCINRFRSYDVASRTYLGYDGRRHSCP